MRTADIALMYDYSEWANRHILSCAAKVTPEQFTAPSSHSFGSLHGTIFHIIAAEYGWRLRLQKLHRLESVLPFAEVMTPDLSPAEHATIPALEARLTDEMAAWRAFLATITDADMDHIVRYEVDGGAVRERRLWHCLYHVVNHGMQHRSEAANLLTIYGQSPGDIDFTVFLNVRGVA
jgi:uncharacterized damage-inducible protein DinB